MDNLSAQVDVLMPVYNMLKYKLLLIKAILSVINQTYKNWILTIIDDFSTDGTYKFLIRYLKKINNKKIKLLRNSVNKGCYISLNKAILKTSGDYITRLDSDDYFHNNKLLEQVKILKNKNIVATYCSNIIIKTKKVTFFNCITLMFKKGIVDKVGYYDSVRYGADSEFLDRLVLIYGNKLYGLKKILYYVNKRKSSLTMSNDTGTIQNTKGSKKRKNYKKRYKQWHKKNIKNLYMSYPLEKRLF